MQSVSISHCRGNYFREFAYKTNPGIDMPDSNGFLADLRRNRIMPIMSDEHLESAIKTYENRPGEYVSVYSYSKLNKQGVVYESAKINRIYLDFDNEEDPQKSIDEALLVIKYMTKQNIYCHCYFSGGKGIALYIEFPVVEIRDENKKEVLKMFVDSIISGIGTELKCLDYKVSFDLARVSRIPNTKHKSGLFCIPVTLGGMRKGIQYIKDMAKAPTEINLEHVITSCMRRNTTMKNTLIRMETHVIYVREHQPAPQTQFKPSTTLLTMESAQNHITPEQIDKAKRLSVSSLFGNEIRMKCPLHNGNNPSSFQIDHKNNLWYCHSCGKGGDPIKYIMLKHNLSFNEAVKMINNI